MKNEMKKINNTNYFSINWCSDTIFRFFMNQTEFQLMLHQYQKSVITIQIVFNVTKFNDRFHCVYFTKAYSDIR